MKIGEILNECGLSGHDIVQFMDYQKFIKYVNSTDASWQDYKNAEIVAVEYRDLINSRIIEKYADLNVRYACRKHYDDREGIALLIDNDDSRGLSCFKNDIYENLVVSGFSFKFKGKEKRRRSK